MMKAEVNSDELLADSIQIDNYLKQKKIVLNLEIDTIVQK